jgi:hypothetical protein
MKLNLPLGIVCGTNFDVWNVFWSFDDVDSVLIIGWSARSAVFLLELDNNADTHNTHANSPL